MVVRFIHEPIPQHFICDACATVRDIASDNIYIYLYMYIYMYICNLLAAGQQFDFLGNSGFALAVNSAVRLAPGGLAPLGPTCSTWVFLSRGSTGRTMLFPIGWESCSGVRNANIMAARVCVIVMLITFYKAYVLLEQPTSSLFTLYPRWIMTLRILRSNGIRMWRQLVHLGAFGAPSNKPLHIISNCHALLSRLWRPLLPDDKLRFLANTQHLVRKSISKCGKPQVTGVPAGLRQSQCHPYIAAVYVALWLHM
jgi:hypothetical protein